MIIVYKHKGNCIDMLTGDLEVVTVSDVYRYQLISTSKGNQAKWYKDRFYIKADELGYEGLAEVIVSTLCKCIQGLNFVDYHLCNIVDESSGYDYLGCYSKDFKSKNSQFTTFYRILKLMYGDDLDDVRWIFGKDLYDLVVNNISKYVHTDITGYVNSCIALDALILGEDRHFNNFGVLTSNNGVVPAPIFDNGLSLLSDIKNYPLTMSYEILIDSVKSRPFSLDFDEQISYMRNFKPFSIDITRLNVLLEDLYKTIVNETVNGVLCYTDTMYNRAVTVLFNQLQKYKGVLWNEI